MKKAFSVLLLALASAGASLAQVSINSNTALPGAAASTPYTFNLYAAGGTAPYTWTLTGGALPAGLTLSSTGSITGSPTVNGSFSFTVTVQDSAGSSAVKAFTVNVSGLPLTLSPASGTLPDAAGGAPYIQQFTASGGSGNYTYLLLPNAQFQSNYFDLDTKTGELYGNPLVAGTFTFSVQVIDSDQRMVTQNYTLTVTPQTSIGGVDCASLPTGTPGATYPTTQVPVSGGVQRYQFTLPSGQTSPPGLILTSDGKFMGVLGATSATGLKFDIQVSDSFGKTITSTCGMPINQPGSLTITTSSPLTPAVVGSTYSQTFVVEGTNQSSGPVSWSALSNLPPWLSIDSATGVLTGTPPATGTFTFTIVATQQTGSAPFVSQKDFTLLVAANPLTITTPSPLPAGVVDRAYYVNLTASANPIALTTVYSGSLPPGLSLIGQQIVGTPLGTGSYSFTIQMTHADGRTATKTFALTINQVSEVAIQTTSPLPVGYVGALYSDIFTATPVGASPYLWSQSLSLPTGIGLNTGGFFGGTPAAAYNSSFLAQVTPSANEAPSVQSLALIIRAQALTVSTASLPSGSVGAPYSAPITVIGGAGAPYGLGVSAGSLPPGLTLSGGQIAGIPTLVGTYNFTVSASDSDGATATRSYALIVISPLTIVVPSLPTGTVGAAYPGAQFTGSGGTPPYTWGVVAGSLPAGLTLDPQTGLLSGTPTAAGTSQFMIGLADSGNQVTRTSNLSIVVVAQPTITVPALPGGTVGVTYAGAQFTGAGGTPPYTWSIVSGALPAGLTLNPQTGAVTGTPTAAGTSQFVVGLTDSTQRSARTQTLSISVAAQLTITVPTLPGGTVGTAYPGAQFAGAGGTPPYTWSIVSGALPAGLTLNPQTGAVTGTPTAAGASQFVVGLTDSARQSTQTSTLSISVAAQLTITVPALPGGTVGTAYPGAQFTGAGGTPPYTWSIVSGALPAGLTLNPQTGAVTGTPTAAGVSQFIVGLTDSARQSTQTTTLSISVAAQLTITVPALPGGTVAVAYPGAQFTGAGGTPPYTWSIVSGALPAGLILNSQTGAVTGTPTAAGVSQFVIGLTDSARQSARTPALSITVTSQPSITVPFLPAPTVGTPYPATQFVGTGGTPPYTWSIVSGALPTGLALNPQTGIVTGTPASAVTTQFVVGLTDSAGQTARTGTLTLSVNKPPNLPSILTPPLPNGTVGVPYPQTQFSVTGGTPPYTWALTQGSLPPGLTLSFNNGVLTGTPTTAGTSSFMVTVTDGSGASSSTPLVSLTINKPTTPPLTIAAPALPSGTVNVAYPAGQFTAAGGTAPYSFAISQGGLPAGLSLSGQGALSGTPTTAGTTQFAVTVTDSTGATASTGALSITINRPQSSPLTITAPALPNGTVNVAYASGSFSASGGTTPYTFAITQGSLPAGLTLNTQTGLLSGTPTTAGTSQFAVGVTDAAGGTAATGQLSITILGPPPAITNGPLPGATAGSTYTETLTATGAGPFTWTLLNGSLPAGLTLGSDGVISGSPAVSGTFPFTVQVTDGQGQTASLSVTLTVGLPPLPGVTIHGLPTAGDAQLQPSFGVTLASPYPVAITGQVTLTFKSSAVAASDDPSIQFSTGGRTASFTIPAGQTEATFSVPQIAFSTGTVAGTITLTATFQAGQSDITPAPAPSQSVTIPPEPPKILSVALTTTSTGVSVVVTGFSTPRQVTSATFTFAVTGGSSASMTVNVDLTSAFAQWYQSAASTAFGSSFVYTQPFTLSGPGTVSSVTVTLTNAQGASTAVTH